MRGNDVGAVGQKTCLTMLIITATIPYHIINIHNRLDFSLTSLDRFLKQVYPCPVLQEDKKQQSI